jgi:hypothetical protein
LVTPAKISKEWQRQDDVEADIEARLSLKDDDEDTEIRRRDAAKRSFGQGFLEPKVGEDLHQRGHNGRKANCYVRHLGRSIPCYHRRPFDLTPDQMIVNRNTPGDLLPEPTTMAGVISDRLETCPKLRGGRR